MIDPEETEVMEIAENIHKIRREKKLDDVDIYMPAWKLKFETALVVDALHLFYDALYDLVTDERKHIKQHPILCHRNDNWNEGYTLTNIMKTVRIRNFIGYTLFQCFCCLRHQHY